MLPFLFTCIPHHWHPHQLRHAYATYVRKQFGLEVGAKSERSGDALGAEMPPVLPGSCPKGPWGLGHRSAAVTTIYAEQDTTKASKAIARAGSRKA